MTVHALWLEHVQGVCVCLRFLREVERSPQRATLVPLRELRTMVEELLTIISATPGIEAVTLVYYVMPLVTLLHTNIQTLRVSCGRTISIRRGTPIEQ